MLQFCPPSCWSIAALFLDYYVSLPPTVSNTRGLLFKVSNFNFRGYGEAGEKPTTNPPPQFEAHLLSTVWPFFFLPRTRDEAEVNEVSFLSFFLFARVTSLRLHEKLLFLTASVFQEIHCYNASS